MSMPQKLNIGQKLALIATLLITLALSSALLVGTVLQVRATPDSVQFQSETYYVDEHAGTATVTVTLDFTPGAGETYTVDYVTSNGTAVDCNDYDNTHGTLTFTAGVTRQTFTIPINDDATIESDESVNLTLSNPTGGTMILGTPTSATLVIQDDDATPTVHFGANGFIVGEDSQEAIVMVTLEEPLTQTVQVDYSTSDGSATAPGDYAHTAGTLTFAPGQTRAFFKVAVSDDGFLEGSETVTLDLANPVHADLGSPIVTSLTIYDESASPGKKPLIFFNSDSYVVDESAQNATVVVVLSTSPTQTVKVDYSTYDSSATAGSDYAASSGTLTFAPDQTLITFTVPISDDVPLEGNESLRIDLSNPVNAELDDSHKNTSLTIIDDEYDLTVYLDSDIYSFSEDVGLANLGVTLSEDYGQPITVTYNTHNGSAIAPADYTAATLKQVVFAPCQTHQTLSIPIIDDAFDEPDETFTVALESVTPSPKVKIAHPDTADVTIQDDDIPMVQFDHPPYSVVENIAAGEATITVTLTPTSTWQTVTVTTYTQDDEAVNPDDYTSNSSTLIFPPGQVHHTFKVPIHDDALDELDEDLALHLSNVQSDRMHDAVITGPNPTSLTIRDNDPSPNVQFSHANYDAPEDSGTALITVTLDAPSSRPITVTYDTVEGSATAGQDYTDVNGKLYFTPGETERTLAVPITNDSLYEWDETVALHLLTANNATITGTNPATLTILDNDPAPTVQFSTSDYRIAEDGGSATITVTLNTPSGLTATVDYATTDSSATATRDYSARNGTLTFLPGVTSATFTVPILDDILGEADETVILTLANSVRATSGTPDTAMLTILDNDVPTVQFEHTTYSTNEGAGTVNIAVTLNKTYVQSVTVDYTTHNGTAIAPDDYGAISNTLTFTPGQTRQSFTLNVVDDAMDEDSETLTIALADPVHATVAGTNPVTVTIADNDPEPTVQFANSTYSVGEGEDGITTYASVTVTLDPPSGREVTITYSTSDGTAVAGDDYAQRNGTLVFLPGQTNLAFTVPITDDLLYEENETITLRLTSATNAAVGARNPANLTIVDDETPPKVQFSQSPYSVAENESLATVTVTLSAPSATPATVAYTTGDDTANAGDDYTATSGRLTFAPGQTQQTLNVPIVDDTRDEPDETITLTLSDPLSATLGTPDTATLTIVDDDTPTVQFAQSVYQVDEDAGIKRITVTLNTPAGQTITVDYASSTPPVSSGQVPATPGSDYRTTSGQLTFDPGERSQSFTVTVNDDNENEPAESVVLTLSNPVNAVLGTPDSAVLTILDDDGLKLQFSRDVYRVREADGTTIVTVTLNRASMWQTVTVNYRTSNHTATAGRDYVASQGTLTFSPGEIHQTFTLDIIDDSSDEAVETVNLYLSNATNATISSPNPVPLHIIDDDMPEVKFSHGTYDVNESTSTASIAVMLTDTSWHTITVAYQVADSTSAGDGVATAFADYVPTHGYLTFAPGQTNRVLQVSILDDEIDEEDETVTVTLNTPISATLGAPYTSTLVIKDDDTLPFVQFRKNNYRINETDGSTTIDVDLNKTYVQTVTVNCVPITGTATAGHDYTPTVKTLTFPPGESSQPFNIQLIDDDEFEPNETAVLTLCHPTNAMLGTPKQVVLEILSEDLTYAFLPLILKNYPWPKINFETTTYAVVEDHTTVEIKVTLERTSNMSITVAYATSDGTATGGQDYQSISGTLTFAPGQTSQSFDITIQDDEYDEQDETVMVSLSDPVNADLEVPGLATLTIIDNDDPPTIRFTSKTYTTTENAGTAVVTVALSTPSGQAVSVDYTTSDDTAIASDDYQTISGTLAFVPGTTQRTFIVEILDDAQPEPHETAVLRLSNPANAYLSTPNPADLRVLDDDVPSVRFSQTSYSTEENNTSLAVQVTLSDYPWRTVQVDYTTEDDTANAGEDYTVAQGTLTFEPGDLDQTFSVAILEDTLDEYDETLTLRLSAPINAELSTPNPADLTIVDDDPLPNVHFEVTSYRAEENAGSVTIAATLDAPSGRTVKVNYATANGSALAGEDYTPAHGTLTFVPGQTRQTFTVAINDDAIDEPDEETVTIRLNNPVNAELDTPNPITLTIVDNDHPPHILFSTADYSVGEGERTIVIPVKLSAASGKQVTVRYFTEDGTAVAGQDYVATSGQLTFNPGETSQTFEVTVIDDSYDEADKTLALKLNNEANASLGTPSQATLTIVDDDTPMLQFSASSYSVDEGAGEAIITVTLTLPPWQAATVDYATGDLAPGAGQVPAKAGSDYTATSGTLTFEPGETSQTFTIAIADDAIDEPAEALALTLRNPVNALLGVPEEAPLTIEDNNDPSPTVQFSASSYSVDETINIATITATLSAVSGWPISVTYATQDGTASAIENDYETVTSTLTFAPGQIYHTFDIVVIDDRLDEDDETVTLTLSAPTHATLGTPNQSTLIIMDDDPIPDLVGSFSLEPDKRTFTEGEPVTITVVITNRGTVAANPFWADFFINPSTPPEHSNTIWSDYCSMDPCFGISWYIPIDLQPGQSIKLTSTYGSYADGYTVWPGYFASGTSDLYLYIDSWNPGVPSGAVPESYEDNNRTELHGLVVTDAHMNHELPKRCIDLPPRPPRLDE